MEYIFFTAISPQGDSRQLSFGGPSLALCLDVVTMMVLDNWQMTAVKLHSEKGFIDLPIEAFDHNSMGNSLEAIQQEIKQLLAGQ